MKSSFTIISQRIIKTIKVVLLAFMLPYSVNAQVNQVNFIHERIDFSAAPRTKLDPMSIKLWDNYSNGGPTTYGTVMEITGFSGHQTSQLYFGGLDNSKIKYREAFYGDNVWSDWITLLDSKNDIESTGKLLIRGTGNHSVNGNLSIGTLNHTPGAMLTVAGLVSSREVKVAISAGADYVFDKNFKLLPLLDLENYVIANKHLPEIASEAEMKTDGINVSEFQISLLKKIEELTLYMIEQNKSHKALLEEVGILKEELNNLKSKNNNNY